MSVRDRFAYQEEVAELYGQLDRRILSPNLQTHGQ